MGQRTYTIDAYLCMERGNDHATVADRLLQLGASVHDIDNMLPFEENDSSFHVVIVDSSPASFARCIEHFQKIGNAVPIVRCESRLDPIKIARGLQQGISSFVRYPPNVGELCRGIELAHGRIDDANRRYAAGRARAALSALTRRQRQITAGLFDGLTNKELAKACDISERTVEVHRARIIEKLKVRNTAGLIRLVSLAGQEAYHLD